jgi:hypothetical protein
MVIALVSSHHGSMLPLKEAAYHFTVMNRYSFKISLFSFYFDKKTIYC